MTAFNSNCKYEKSAGVVALLSSQERVTVSGYFLIRNSFFPDSQLSPSTCYRIHCGFIKCHSGERFQKLSGFTGSACGRKLSTLLFTNFGATRSNVTSYSQNLFTTIKSTTLLKASLTIGSLTRQLVPTDGHYDATAMCKIFEMAPSPFADTTFRGFLQSFQLQMVLCLDLKE